jgi:hypothetical protein
MRDDSGAGETIWGTTSRPIKSQADLFESHGVSPDLLPRSHVRDWSCKDCLISSKSVSMIRADSPLVNKFLAQSFSTIWALVTVIDCSSKTKVQDLSGFGRFDKVMREAYYFGGFPQASCDVQNPNIS